MVVVFIESNTTGTGYLLAEKAIEKGLSVVVLAKNPNKYQFGQDVRIESVDTGDIKALRHHIFEVHTTLGVAAVLSSSEYFIYTAALLAKELGLQGANPEAVAKCRDKYRFRQVVNTRVGEPVTNALLYSEKTIEEVIRTVGLPMVVKPRSGSGSCSVSLCQSFDDVEKAISSNRSFLQSRGQELSNIGCLAEKFVSGPEYSVECFHGQVISITRKLLGAEPHFVEIGHDLNFDLDERTESMICSEVASILAFLELTWGPVHIEIRVGKDSIAFIEVNPRLAGGMIPVLICHCLGIDLLTAWLSAALGETPILTATEHKQGAIRFLVPKSGEFIVHGLDEGLLKRITKKHGFSYRAIVDAKLYKHLGHEIDLHGDFSDRIGHIMLSAPVVDFAKANTLQSAVLSEVVHA